MSDCICLFSQRARHTDAYCRRTLEVAALAVLTGTLWFGVSYGSPCRPVPLREIQALLSPELLPSNIVTFAQYNNYPRLWCSAGQYSVYGRASPATFPTLMQSHTIQQRPPAIGRPGLIVIWCTVGTAVQGCVVQWHCIVCRCFCGRRG